MGKIGYLDESELPEPGECALNQGMNEDGDIYLQVTQADKNFASIILDPDDADRHAAHLLALAFKARGLSNPKFAEFMAQFDALRARYGIGTYFIVAKDPDSKDEASAHDGDDVWVYGRAALFADKLRREFQ